MTHDEMHCGVGSDVIYVDVSMSITRKMLDIRHPQTICAGLARPGALEESRAPQEGFFLVGGACPTFNAIQGAGWTAHLPPGPEADALVANLPTLDAGGSWPLTSPGRPVGKTAFSGMLESYCNAREMQDRPHLNIPPCSIRVRFPLQK